MQQAHTEPWGPEYSPREGTFPLKYGDFVSWALTPSDCTARTFHNHTPWAQKPEWGKKPTGIQQGNLGSSNNSTKDIQDPPRIFGEVEDNLMCVLAHNPVRQERQMNYYSYFRQRRKRGAAFLEGLERIKGTLWSWERCARSWGRGTAVPCLPRAPGDN